MSVLIEKIHQSLKESTSDWSWEFAYAPKPGQQRIKIIAVNKQNPEQRKVLVLAEDLFKKVPMQNLAQNIVRLIPTLPEGSGELPCPRHDMLRPMRPVEKACSAREQYQYMRRAYQDAVSDLRGGRCAGTEQDWTQAVSRGFQRFVVQFGRKSI